MCSAGELCGVLFEDREEDNALKKQLRVFMSGLRVICMAVPVLSLIWQVHITNFFYLVNVIHSSFRLIIRSSPSIVYSYVFVPSVVTIS